MAIETSKNTPGDISRLTQIEWVRIVKALVRPATTTLRSAHALPVTVELPVCAKVYRLRGKVNSSTGGREKTR